mmetsp:Transcript_32367/g.48056  ORF Transcript_32367/g.48056 Transcript_32367/m.48056 type:complete len:92 (+) Transcript_32367:304-579(+)
MGIIYKNSDELEDVGCKQRIYCSENFLFHHPGVGSWIPSSFYLPAIRSRDDALTKSKEKDRCLKEVPDHPRRNNCHSSNGSPLPGSGSSKA